MNNEAAKALTALWYNLRIYLCLVLVGWLDRIIPANAPLKVRFALFDLTDSLECFEEVKG